VDRKSAWDTRNRNEQLKDLHIKMTACMPCLALSVPIGLAEEAPDRWLHVNVTPGWKRGRSRAAPPFRLGHNGPPPPVVHGAMMSTAVYEFSERIAG
jgi:hypothetical protein